MIRLTVYKTASLLDTSSEIFTSVFFHLELSFGWSLSQPPQSERQGTSRTGRQSITGLRQRQTTIHSHTQSSFEPHLWTMRGTSVPGQNLCLKHKTPHRKEPTSGLKPGLSYCEAMVLTTAPQSWSSNHNHET